MTQVCWCTSEPGRLSSNALRRQATHLSRRPVWPRLLWFMRQMLLFIASRMFGLKGCICMLTVHPTLSDSTPHTAVTVTCQSKLALCKHNTFLIFIASPPSPLRLEWVTTNLFFTIKVHRSHYHYTHSNIVNQHCTLFTLWYNHIYCLPLLVL